MAQDATGRPAVPAELKEWRVKRSGAAMAVFGTLSDGSEHRITATKIYRRADGAAVALAYPGAEEWILL